MEKNKVNGLHFSGLKKIFQLTAIILVTALPFLLVYFYDPKFFNSITQYKNHHLMGFRFLRWGLILFFIFSWSRIIRKLGNLYAVSNEQIIRWQAEIFRVAIWMMLFEILICENIINKIIHSW